MYLLTVEISEEIGPLVGGRERVRRAVSPPGPVGPQGTEGDKWDIRQLL